MDAAGLLPYQVEPVHCLIAALSLHNAALDASDCGVGKTFHAAAVVRHLVLPTLVVCPKISVTGWECVLEQMQTSADVKNYEMLATGRTPYGRWEHPLPAQKDRKWEYVCEGCQCKVDLVRTSRCPVRPSGVHCVHPKRLPHDYGKFIWHEAIKLLVFDEVHKCGGLDSLNSNMLVAAKRQNITTLCLSATAVESPLGFKALGYVLGLHGGPSCFYKWARARGCSRPVFGGLHFLVSEERKQSIMSALHHDLFPSRGVRVRVNNIPGFPSAQIRAELYDLETSGKIDELYQTMSDAIAELNDTKAGDKCSEHPLTMLLRASQQIELLKVPVFLTLWEDAIEAGFSVAIFVSYTQTLQEILKRTKTQACIHGGQTTTERGHWIAEFQENRETTITANIRAGGQSVSLHDLAGRPRLGLCSLHPSAVCMKQVFGRLARAGGLSPALYRIPLIANTVEQKLHKRLSSKLDCMDLLNDGDLTAINLPLSVGCLADILEE